MKTWKQKELKENEKIIDEKLYESSEEKDEWIKIPKLGIEVQKELAVKETKFKDIKIPKECRLMTFQEACHLWDNFDYEVFKLGEEYEWIEHYSEKMAKLGLVSALDSYWDLGRRRLGVVGGYRGNGRNSYAFGVRFVRPLKEKK